MRNNTHAHSIFPRENNLIKTPLPTCINMMNRDVLQLLYSTEHKLQVNNLCFLTKNIWPRLSHFLPLLEPLFPCTIPKEIRPLLFGNFLQNTCAIHKIDHLTACNTFTLKASIQLMLKNLGISTKSRKIEFSACISYFWLIDQLNGWSLSLTEVSLHKWLSTSSSNN